MKKIIASISLIAFMWFWALLIHYFNLSLIGKWYSFPLSITIVSTLFGAYVYALWIVAVDAVQKVELE